MELENGGFESPLVFGYAYADSYLRRNSRWYWPIWPGSDGFLAFALRPDICATTKKTSTKTKQQKLIQCKVR